MGLPAPVKYQRNQSVEVKKKVFFLKKEAKTFDKMNWNARSPDRSMLADLISQPPIGLE